MNGGGESKLLKDSTIAAIDHRYGDNVPSADFMGSLYVGENPNSDVNDGDVIVLCKGIYDVDNMSDNTNSSDIDYSSGSGDGRVPVFDVFFWIPTLNKT